MFWTCYIFLGCLKSNKASARRSVYLWRLRGSASQLLPSLEDLRSKDLRSLRCRVVPPDLLKRQCDQFQVTASQCIFSSVRSGDQRGNTEMSKVSWRPSSLGLSRHRSVLDQQIDAHPYSMPDHRYRTSVGKHAPHLISQPVCALLCNQHWMHPNPVKRSTEQTSTKGTTDF